MPAGQLISFVNAIPSPWGTIVKMLLAVVGSIYMVFKTFKYIPEGHKGLRLRFQVVVRKDGQPVMLRKGLHIMFPFVHNIQVVNVLDRTINLRATSLLTGKFQAFSVRTSVVFAVTDIYKLSYGAEEPMPRLKAACEDALRKALVTHPLRNGALESVKIIEVFTASVAEEAEELGVTFKKLNVQEVKPDSGMAVANAIDSLGPSVATTLGLDIPTTNGKSTQ